MDPHSNTGLLKPWTTKGDSEVMELPSYSGSGNTWAGLEEEPRKTVISKGIWDNLSWHIFTIISVGGTAVLLYLNFIEYSIGAEVGANQKETANILGALQIAVKAHELAIVASLVVIAQQWILGNLIKDGIPLGLLGAETALGGPTFVISKEYRTAIRYGLSGLFGARKLMPGEKSSRRKVFLLSVFLFIACVLASLAGPASGVLMIPQLTWFSAGEIASTLEDVVGEPTAWFRDFPDMLIDTSMAYFIPSDIGIKYWYSLGDVNTNYKWSGGDTELTHRFTDWYSADAYVHTSTTWDRTLDGAWTTGTNVKTIMRWNTAQIVAALNHLPKDLETQRKKKWRRRQYITDVDALDANVVCRKRDKQSCGSGNSNEWCYTGVDGDQTTLRNSGKLLLLRQGWRFSTADTGASVWITEGPLENGTKFASSMEVVLEDIEPSTTLIVCSISTVMRTGEATFSSNGMSFYASEVSYLDYQKRGGGTTEPPRTVKYYEHWLDGVTSQIATGNFTYPPRSASNATDKLPLNLQYYGWSVGNSSSFNWGNGVPLQSQDAGEFEVTVGGAFVYLLSWIHGNGTQYQVGESYLSKLPADALPEPPRAYIKEYEHRMKVYYEAYGFRLSSRTGLLGVTVLFAHGVIAILASLWQLLWRRRVIIGWSTVPEFAALGVGSTSRAGVLENTCAGISAKRTLGSVIKVGETTPNHLELVAMPSGPQQILNPVGLGTYGYRG